MKRILFILGLVLFSIHGNLQTNPRKESCLYFCISRSLHPFESTGKIRILYTDLREIDCSQAIIKLKSESWGQFVDSIYKRPDGATSDLNYYPDLASAKKVFDKFQALYSDTSKYILERVMFDL